MSACMFIYANGPELISRINHTFLLVMMVTACYSVVTTQKYNEDLKLI